MYSALIIGLNKETHYKADLNQGIEYQIFGLVWLLVKGSGKQAKVKLVKI